jgi:1-deoxy-D-xylulose-5-phosphate reductoisomerase
MVKKVAILGSTGSIGKNALRVIDSLNSKETGFEVTALSAHNNVELLAKQVRQWKPEFAVITNQEKYNKLKELTAGCDTQILAGAEGMVEIAQLENNDIVLSAVVGLAGLSAVLAAAKKGKRLAIANKEPLAVAGKLVTETARAAGAQLLPIDSEHSAIFQALCAGKPEEVAKIILTTSGGPFRKSTIEQMRTVTVEQALAHPVWNMGPKITIDSATMMNKALEVIEARWLFDMPVEKIEVLVHPESIIHSLVEFIDGSVIAQMSQPDMVLPIQYALTWPNRQAGLAKRLELDQVGRLTFEKPDSKTFKVLKICFDVARAGGTAPAVFNAANEAAVELFLAGRIKFLEIIELIELCLNKHNIAAEAGLNELLEADQWARKIVLQAVKKETVGK